MDILRRSARAKRAPLKLAVAGASLAKRVMLAVTVSMVAGTSRTLCSHSGCDTLPEPLQAPSVPQGEDVFYGKSLDDMEIAKLMELTSLDRVNDDTDHHWGVERVLEHRTKRVVQRIPKHYSVEAHSEGSKIRLKVQFHDGWTNMDAEML